MGLEVGGYFLSFVVQKCSKIGFQNYHKKTPSLAVVSFYLGLVKEIIQMVFR